jgi:hypothetical protein
MAVIDSFLRMPRPEGPTAERRAYFFDFGESSIAWEFGTVVVFPQADSLDIGD